VRLLQMTTSKATHLSGHTVDNKVPYSSTLSLQRQGEHTARLSIETFPCACCRRTGKNKIRGILTPAGQYLKVGSKARKVDLVGTVAPEDCHLLAKRLLDLFEPAQLRGPASKLTQAVCNSFVAKHVGEPKILMWLALDREVGTDLELTAENNTLNPGEVVVPYFFIITACYGENIQEKWS